MLILVLLCATTTGQESTETRHSAKNAAVKYLQAYAALRQSLSSTSDVFTPETALAVPLTPAVEKIVENASEAFRELRHGATLGDCDWQISAEDGALANTSHRGAVRELVAVSILRARLRLRENKVEAALDDAWSATAMARQLSLDGTIASVLISYRLENLIEFWLAQNLTRFTSEQLQSLTTRFDHLPSGANLSRALIAEKLQRSDFNAVLKESGSRAELIESLMQQAPALKSDRALATEIVDRCGGTVQGFAHCVDEQRSLYEDMSGRFQESPEQFERVYRERFSAMALTNPVIGNFTPALDRLRWAEAYHDTRRALFQCAVAVQLQGRNVLDRQRDPYDGTPFTFTPINNGFRLDSRLKENDVPLSITVH